MDGLLDSLLELPVPEKKRETLQTLREKHDAREREEQERRAKQERERRRAIEEERKKRQEERNAAVAQREGELSCRAAWKVPSGKTKKKKTPPPPRGKEKREVQKEEGLRKAKEHERRLKEREGERLSAARERMEAIRLAEEIGGRV